MTDDELQMTDEAFCVIRHLRETYGTEEFRKKKLFLEVISELKTKNSELIPLYPYSPEYFSPRLQIPLSPSLWLNSPK